MIVDAVLIDIELGAASSHECVIVTSTVRSMSFATVVTLEMMRRAHGRMA